MKAQQNSGLRVLAILAVSALVGFAQAPTGAQGAPAAPGGANYAGTNVPSTNVSSQQRTVYPGSVNYVEGQATLDGQPLTPAAVGSAVIGPNQVLATTNGYVEVLLTPGAFLRVGHDSEAKLISAGLTGVQLQLNRGSAMVEAADVVRGSNLNVTVNGVPVQIEKKGLYSFDAARGLVRVLDGKANVQEAVRTITLKKGDELAVNGEPSKKHDFDIKSAEKEPLYVWSKVRSEDESQANLHAVNLIAAGGSWYGPGWYWDPLWAGYAFIPGTGILYSPFGWGYYAPGFYGGLWGGYGYVHGYYGHPRYFARGGYTGLPHARVGGIGTMHAATGFHRGHR